MRTRLLLICSVLVPILMMIPLAGNGAVLSALNWQSPTSTPLQGKPASAPVLLTPAQGETVTSNEVVLSVAPMQDASIVEYFLYIDDAFLKQRLPVGESWTITLADYDYSWAARGLNVYGFGPVSERWDFSVAGSLTASPTATWSPTPSPTSNLSDAPFQLIAPLLGEQVESPVTFQVILGAGTFQLQSLEVFDSSVNQVLLLDSSTCCTANLPPGDYIWEATSCRPMGCATSPTYFFTVIGPTPTPERPPAPTPLSPPHRSQTDDSFPSFTWTSVSGAVNYRIMVFDHKHASERTVDLRENSLVPSIQLSTPLEPDRYFWRVRARANGVWSLWSIRFTLWVVDHILTPTPT